MSIQEFQQALKTDANGELLGKTLMQPEKVCERYGITGTQATQFIQTARQLTKEVNKKMSHS